MGSGLGLAQAVLRLPVSKQDQEGEGGELGETCPRGTQGGRGGRGGKWVGLSQQDTALKKGRRQEVGGTIRTGHAALKP